MENENLHHAQAAKYTQPIEPFFCFLHIDIIDSAWI